MSLEGRSRGDYAKNTLYTGSAIAIGNAVQLAGEIVEFEQKFYRDGEVNREGKPKYYQVDVLVAGFLCVEAEGPGSKSSDNPERDAYLESLGLELHHLSNERIKCNKQDEVAVILAKVEARKHRVVVLDRRDVVCSGCEVAEVCPHADGLLIVCPIGFNQKETIPQ